jgi:sulfhydrogenase subunit alpha
MSRTIAVEQLARVEGHGGIAVELDGDGGLRVRFDIFEGARLLERLVRGRSYHDLPQILSRICAICSTAHALTSIKAIENAFGVEVSPQTRELRELMFIGENIESHALHLFLLALPDYLGYSGAPALSADQPDVVRAGLRLKKLGNAIQEAIGGRAIHPVNAIPGGFGRTPGEDQLIALRRDLMEAAADCASAVEIFAALPPVDFCRSQTAFVALQSPKGGGYYAGDQIIIRSNGAAVSASACDYRSLIGEAAVAHSHAKHSLHRGQPVMTGSLARLAVNQDATEGEARHLMAKLGLVTPSDDPMDNNKAQLVELVGDVRRALQMVDGLLAAGIDEEAPVDVQPLADAGAAATEAPRGLLIHSYTFDEQGRIVMADVVTPTAINAASIERSLRRTAEHAGATDNQALVKRLEMVARAYDPCISCSVH